jgi:Protein of unknown function (DUF5818)
MRWKNAVLCVATMTVAFGFLAPSVRSDSIHSSGFAVPQPAKYGQAFGQSKENADAKVFSGTIWMNGGRFVLRDEHQRLWYQLEVDQKLVAKFEGKHVKVIGTQAIANSAIHVQRIEED